MIGTDVKRVRQALGLTQQQFAERLGVHKVTVAKWETDAQGMRGPAARLIALMGQSATAGAGKAKAQRSKPRAARRPRKATRRKI